MSDSRKRSPHPNKCLNKSIVKHNLNTMFGYGLPVSFETSNEDSYPSNEENVVQLKMEEIHSHQETHTPSIDNVNICPIDNINICFVGGVSTGKSTILNAIFCEELTQCKIKRTTMVPTIYIENEPECKLITPPEHIFETISRKNNEIIEKTEKGIKLDSTEYNELVFNVGKLDINILNDAYVNVYDIPGLNDARTKNVYYNYLKNNFSKFNLVIFIVDIHSGLNTSDEIDIVQFIASNTKYQLDHNNKKIYTLVVVNKADDMQLDEDNKDDDKLLLTGELNEMYEQVENTVRYEFSKQNVVDHLIGIMPLCAIDSYLYRRVKKHGKNFKLTPEQILKIGINENGKKFSTLKPATQEKKVYEILQDADFIDTMIKLSGFSCLEKTLHKFLSENNTGKTIRVNNLLFELSKFPSIETVMKKGLSSFSSEETINTLIKYNDTLQRIKNIDEALYTNHTIEIATNLIKCIKKDVKKYECYKMLLADYAEFETFIMQMCFVEFSELFEDFEQTTRYPSYITEQVLYLLEQHLTTRIKDPANPGRYISFDRLMFDGIKVLKWLGCYTKNTVERVIKQSLWRCQSTNYTSETFGMSMEEIVKQLSDLKSDGHSILEYIRFFIIMHIKICCNGTCNMRALLALKMLYDNYNEANIKNFIDFNIRYLAKINPNALYQSSLFDLEAMYVTGETGDEIDFTLSLYYLNTFYKKL
jgi:GTP-binding protein EngB required for normal cell division